MIDSVTAKELKNSTKRLASARKKEDAAWEEHVELIKLAVERGAKLSEVATLIGVTKARVWQIVRDK